MLALRTDFSKIKDKKRKKERKTNAKLRLLVVVDVICETERRETARQAGAGLPHRNIFGGFYCFFN